MISIICIFETIRKILPVFSLIFILLLSIACLAQEDNSSFAGIRDSMVLQVSEDKGVVKYYING